MTRSGLRSASSASICSRSGVRRRRQRSRPQVLDEAAHGLLGVALVGAQDPGRAALDPADGVDAGKRLAVGREHPAALVGEHEVALVERHVGQRHRPVADRAQDEAALDRLHVARRAAAPAASRRRPARSRCGGRRSPRPCRSRGSPPGSAGSAARSAAGRPARGGLAANSRSSSTFLRAVNVPSSASHSLRHRVELDVGGVDPDVDAVEVAQLAQLGARERRLRGTAPAEHDDLLDRGSRAAPRARGRRRRCARARAALSVSMRVTSAATLPLPITTAPRRREVELEVAVVRVAVVPGDELGGGPAAGQVLAGDPERLVGLRAGGVDHRRVVAHQLGVRDVDADLDVAEEAAAAPRASAGRTCPPGA